MSNYDKLGCSGEYVRQLISAILLLSFIGQSQAKTSQALHFGFDSLSSKKATCILITKKLQRNFSKCTQSNGFGPHKPIKTCRIGKSQEWFIYSSNNACQEEIKIMKLNGETA
jgi:hypothetical protein